VTAELQRERLQPPGGEPHELPAHRHRAVRLIFATTSDSINRALTRSGSPVIRLTTPSGTPASAKVATRAIAVRGASTAGHSTMLQPNATAGATLRAGSDAGKFQAVNAATGPTGRRSTHDRRPGSVASTRP
jgi:hypothetical protein